MEFRLPAAPAARIIAVDGAGEPPHGRTTRPAQRQFVTRPTPGAREPESDMKTQGELEAAICEGMSRFEQDYMGRGPKRIQAHLIGALLVIRLHGVLTAADQHLVQ